MTSSVAARTGVWTISADLAVLDDHEAEQAMEELADIIAKRLAHLPYTLTDPEVTFQEINVSAVLDRSL